MGKFFSGDLSAAIPIYVTRETANGSTGSLSISIWMAVLAMFLVWINVIVWSLVGLYEAAKVVF